MIPEKGVKCHRTFGRIDGPIDCRTLVCDHGCRLWKRVTLTERHPETGAEIDKDAYDCLDSQQEIFWKDMLRRQLQTTATVDKVATEMQKTDQQSSAVISTLITQLNRAHDVPRAPQIANGNGAHPLMIEQDDHA